ncbi:unnamed protein product [Urochloa humidicola]
MLLRLGAMPVLVVSSPRAAEAVLRTHDRVCASRPYSLVPEVVKYGPSDVGFVPYGDSGAGSGSSPSGGSRRAPPRSPTRGERGRGDGQDRRGCGGRRGGRHG